MLTNEKSVPFLPRGVDAVDRPVTNRWSQPADCSGPACNYVAVWTVTDDDTLTFSITAKQSADRWTGIAFARQPLMVNKSLFSFPRQL